MNKHQMKAFAELAALMLALILGATLMLPGTAHAYEQKEAICNQGHGYNSAQYLTVHETDNPGASAYNHYRLYSRGYAYAVQYVMDLDGSPVYHCMEDNRKAWAVGNGNSRCVNIELCHATNRADFNRQWDEAVKWCGDYFNKRGWGIDRLISHNDARMRFGGTDHTDPLSYFSSYGKSWNMFKSEVAAYMKTGQTGGTVEQGTTETQAPSSHNGSKQYSIGSTYTVTASALHVRSGASVNYGIVRTYPHGLRFTLLETKGNWGRTPSGWVCMDYATKAAAKSGGTIKSTGNGTYRVTASALNVRTGAGQGYGKVSYRNLTANAKQHAYTNGCLKRGTRVTVMEVRGNWARIPSGWVSMDYLARA